MITITKINGEWVGMIDNSETALPLPFTTLATVRDPIDHYEEEGWSVVTLSPAWK